MWRQQNLLKFDKLTSSVCLSYGNIQLFANKFLQGICVTSRGCRFQFKLYIYKDLNPQILVSVVFRLFKAKKEVF